MHWFSLILGVLIGWIIEWVIDLVYWRRRYYQCTESSTTLRTQLTQARARIAELEDQVAVLRSAAELQSSVKAGEEANRAIPMAARNASAAIKVVQPDDLELIEGIGPAIARLLNYHGIHTFANLAETTPDGLRTILASGGPRFRIADPTTWPEQGRLAALGNLEVLKKYQENLRGGRAA